MTIAKKFTQLAAASLITLGFGASAVQAQPANEEDWQEIITQEKIIDKDRRTIEFTNAASKKITRLDYMFDAYCIFDRVPEDQKSEQEKEDDKKFSDSVLYDQTCTPFEEITSLEIVELITEAQKLLVDKRPLPGPSF